MTPNQPTEPSQPQSAQQMNIGRVSDRNVRSPVLQLRSEQSTRQQPVRDERIAVSQEPSRGTHKTDGKPTGLANRLERA